MRETSDFNRCEKCGLETPMAVDRDQIKRLKSMTSPDFPSSQDVLDELFRCYFDSCNECEEKVKSLAACIDELHVIAFGGPSSKSLNPEELPAEMDKLRMVAKNTLIRIGVLKDDG